MQIKSFSDTELAGISNLAGNVKQRTNNIVAAGNVDLADNREVLSRPGYTQALALPGITAAYFTVDREALFVIAAGELLQVYPGFTTALIASGLDGSEVFWSELGNRIGLSGSVCGMVRRESNTFVPYPLQRPASPSVKAVAGAGRAGDYAIAVVELVSGEQTPASIPSFVTLEDGEGIRVDIVLSAGANGALIYSTTANGSVLYSNLTVDASGSYVISGAPFAGEVLDESLINATGLPGHTGPCAFMGSRWYVAHKDAASDATYIYESGLFRFGLFDLVRDYFPVPGTVNFMGEVTEGLVIGSSKGTWLYPENGAPRQLSHTPVPKHAAYVKDDEGVLWFWTREGLAKAMPYEEVTTDRLDPDSSSQVSLGLVEGDRGDKIIVVTKI